MTKTHIATRLSKIGASISEMRYSLSKLGATLAQIGFVAASLIMLYIVSMCFAVWFISEISAHHNNEMPRVRYEFNRE